MNREELLAYGLSFPNTYQDAPFHDENWQLVRMTGSRKAFLWTYEREGFLNINVKVDIIRTKITGIQLFLMVPFPMLKLSGWLLRAMILWQTVRRSGFMKL